ncbi:Ankyrin repeat-containing protein [Parasponia andersonii]|uniref:Ankyrin repeat-containing protein n=1 Tax=Parasponia andersonii TaxID=3476 RepID=A0A2P5CW05_PARAD|nr:Ankyrin repeat-containing protein [Parasponia andersonii]
MPGVRETALLIASRNGITEMVERILKKFPVAIYDSNKDEKNAVLLALENRQVEVYKLLLKSHAKNESVFRRVDKDGNGALHIAAVKGQLETLIRWPVPGDALQLQWEIKWKRFVESSMPENFFIRYNNEGKTPEDVFTKDHEKLVESGGQWMRSTAESCSVVAALIATVAFATSTSLPGGINDVSGKPTLENQPAFKVFAIMSLIALSFSVTSLAMFLAILTSRVTEKDFGKVLPWKLLMGLTSLFLAIASMLASFCAGHFFALKDTLKVAAFPVYALTSIPVSFFAAAQFPLYIDLVRATFGSPFGDPKKIIDSEK